MSMPAPVVEQIVEQSVQVLLLLLVTNLPLNLPRPTLALAPALAPAQNASTTPPLVAPPLTRAEPQLLVAPHQQGVITPVVLQQ